MKNIIQSILKQRSKIMLLLIVVSLLMTSSTLAYWTEAVEGSSSDKDYTFLIGEYGITHSLFTLSSSSDQGEYSVQPKNIFDNNTGYMHSFTEVFEAEWLSSSSWVDNYHIEGDIEFDYEIQILNQKGKPINNKKYNRLVRYIEVEFAGDNSSSITLNDTPTSFGFTFNITEPSNTNHYSQLNDLTIVVTVSYTINNVTYQYLYK